MIRIYPDNIMQCIEKKILYLHVLIRARMCIALLNDASQLIENSIY